jgi:hypothetical protein
MRLTLNGRLERRTLAERFDELPKLDHFLRAGAMPIVSISLALRRTAASTVHAADLPTSHSRRTTRLGRQGSNLRRREEKRRRRNKDEKSQGSVFGQVRAAKATVPEAVRARNYILASDGRIDQMPYTLTIYCHPVLVSTTLPG